MARTRTLAELRTQVRQAADIENAVAWTDTQLNQIINDSIADLYMVLVECYEDDYTVPVEITTVAGTPGYDLNPSPGTGIFKLRGVEIKINDREYRPMVRFNLNDRWEYDVHGQGMPVAYKLFGKEGIGFYPVPDGVYSIITWVVPPPVELSGDSDEYDGVSGYERYVVLDAAIKVGIQEETDVRAMVGERERMLAKIKASASTKDAGRPDVVQDTEPSARFFDTNSIWWGR